MKSTEMIFLIFNTITKGQKEPNRGDPKSAFLGNLTAYEKLYEVERL